MKRRHLLLASASLLFAAPARAEEAFEITKTDAEWKAILSEAQYLVLRAEETERPNTSPLNAEKRDGLYHCAGCDLAVYSAKAKYDSGTGWPSFWEPLPNSIGTKEDNTLFSTRTEVHCGRCGGHLGHVFDDGPEPTGKRYCMNGVAMTFKPAASSS
jgi:peptide-methionine (R)-S-oxide reductase